MSSKDIFISEFVSVYKWISTYPQIDDEKIKDNVLSNDLESLERAVINYYIDNHETASEENDADESDCDSS